MFDTKIIFNDRDQKVYEDELRDWLPDKIFDAHVHLFSGSCFQDNYVLPPKSSYWKFGGEITIEQYNHINSILLPEQKISTLCFGHPDIHTNIPRADSYVGSICDNKQIFGMTLLSPKTSIEEVKKCVLENKFIGYKPYRNFVDWMDYEDVTINDMLTKEQMELADEMGLAVTLHIPKAKRLADPCNQKQMVEICRDYPNAKIIFAHIGRAYYMQNVVGFLDGIADCENAYLDLAMVSHPGVIEYTFKHFPKDKILFGSDAPIAYLRGKSVEINNQYAYLLGEDYQIGNSIYDPNHTVEFTTFMYEELRGIKEACIKSNLEHEEIENIFYNNAFKLFSSIVEKNY